MARIIIIGSGVVGEATGRGFLQHGHRVEFIDIDPERVDALRRKGLAATAALDLNGPGAFVFIVVPTPHEGRRYDLSYVTTAGRTVGQELRRATHHHTVVLRSTVPPGTTEGVLLPILEEESGRVAYEHFGLASNPEFLRAASNFEDFLLPWMTVIGSRSARTRERMSHLYRPFGGELRTFTNPAKAEFVKVAHNLFNATKISFWNELWRVADRIGFSSDEIAAVVARSSEGSINPEYGIRGGMPYGGACLPKDTYGFIGFAQQLGIDIPLAEAVATVNETMEDLVQAELSHALAPSVQPAPAGVRVHSNGDGASDGDGVIDLTS
jgi:UDPglucose 6-dehydrogenase